MEILTVHARSVCACTCTLVKCPQTDHIVVVFVVALVVNEMDRQIHSAVYKVAPQLTSEQDLRSSVRVGLKI